MGQFLPEPAATSGITAFAPVANDSAVSWLNYLFSAGSSPEASTFLGIPHSVVNSALVNLLGFFSNGMLVIGSVILLYHLLVMIAETAHTGKPMGRANQIWAPLRLVFAIGLLVPINGGLNAGQHVVLWVAEQGSSFASNGWNRFLTSLEAKSVDGSARPMSAEDVLQPSLRTISCVAAHNFQIACEQDNSSDGAPQENSVLATIMQTSRGQRIDFNSYTAAAAVDLYAPDPGNPQFKGGTWPMDNIDNVKVPKVCGGAKILYARDSTTAGHAAAETLNQAAIQLVTQTYWLANNVLNVKSAETSFLGFSWSCDGNIQSKHTGGAAALQGPLKAARTQLQLYVNNYNNAYNEYIGIVGSAPQAPPANMTGKAGAIEGWLSAGAYAFDLARNISSAKTSAGGISYTDVSAVNIRDEDVNKSYQYLMTLTQDAYRILAMRDKNVNMSNVTAGDSTEDSIDGGMRSGMEKTGILQPLEDSSEDNYVISVDDHKYRLAMFTLLDANSYDYTNVLASLVQIGSAKLSSTAWYMGYSIIAGTAGAVAGGISEATQGFAAPLFRVVQFIADKISAMFMFIAIIAFVPALLLFFQLPLLIMVKFLFGALTWIVSVIEAMVAMPLFALAHLNPNGEGAIPDAAKRGYYLLLQIFLRPILMIFALIFCMLLINTTVGYMHEIFMYTIVSAHGSIGIISLFIYVIIFLVLCYSIVNAAVNIIDIVPKQTLTWMGQQAQDSPFNDSGHLNAATQTIGSAVGFSAGQSFARMADMSGAGRLVPKGKQSDEDRIKAKVKELEIEQQARNQFHSPPEAGVQNAGDATPSTDTGPAVKGSEEDKKTDPKSSGNGDNNPKGK